MLISYLNKAVATCQEDDMQFHSFRIGKHTLSLTKSTQPN